MRSRDAIDFVLGCRIGGGSKAFTRHDLTTR
jgi:hypothetical protein